MGSSSKTIKKITINKAHYNSNNLKLHCKIYKDIKMSDAETAEVLQGNKEKEQCQKSEEEQAVMITKEKENEKLQQSNAETAEVLQGNKKKEQCQESEEEQAVMITKEKENEKLQQSNAETAEVLQGNKKKEQCQESEEEQAVMITKEKENEKLQQSNAETAEVLQGNKKKEQCQESDAETAEVLQGNKEKEQCQESEEEQAVMIPKEKENEKLQQSNENLAETCPHHKKIDELRERYEKDLEQIRHERDEYKTKFEELQARYEKDLEQIRLECDKYKTKFEQFQARLRYRLPEYSRQKRGFPGVASDAVVDMGSSGALSEDLNNPCRESELKKMYDKLRLQMLAKYIMEIKKKSKTDKTINETNEKERLKAMLKDVFTKAQQDMTEKKDFLSFFQVDHKTEEGEKQELVKTQDKNTKQQKKKLKYIELALQNLQMIIFHEEARNLQTMYKQPDPLCELADECYKVGCLLALHNPPLLLDWEKKEPSDYLPPIKMEDTSAKTAL
ncbi:probable serine/threonine-protein kinase irlF isoform X5 [Puntigrus tetrazona]|uniref:probable serine/threonine-protein kinase irlF isoform X5 n=1 Tax=Puntigrus tetrazona TaxID=1606681 RepID=UPI001C8A192A|nr:probable serine/threonine-protein kinase irlF isoform X5 [Puntigrus tetrazona]